MANPVTLLALLCCAVVSVAAEETEFRCMYDEMSKNSGALPARIVGAEPDSSKVKGATMSSGTAEWEALRFKVFTEDLKNAARYCTAVGEIRPTFTAPSHTATCKEVDILTDGKKSALLNHMIPKALKMHSDRLLVQPIKGKIMVREYTNGFCGTMTVPQTHKSEGVAGADMILYAAAGPTGAGRAFAGFCSRLPKKRAVVGFMNVGPGMIRKNDKAVRVVAHEIAHALGFSVGTMRSFNMVKSVPNIRGQSRTVVTSSRTLREARAYYKCDRIAGMELENEGGERTVLSHWERRNARDELMAGFAGAGYYSALSMAFFDDLGYFKANWGMEETMEWGRNKGCAFLEEKCVVDGKTKYPDMFCTDSSLTRVCTFGRKGLGYCSLTKHSSLPPAEFRYFKDAAFGGTAKLLDYCPIVVQYENTGCKDGDVAYMLGSRVGPDSMCLKGEGLRLNGYRAGAVEDVCAEVKCNGDSVSVRYSGDDKWHDCPEGKKIAPNVTFTAGEIVCPSYSEVCGGSDGAVRECLCSLYVVLLWVMFFILCK